MAILSAALLIIMGTIGLLVNHSALLTVDAVHLADARAIAVNNATLVSEAQLIGAKELLITAQQHQFTLTRDSRADRAVLEQLRSTSIFFEYGTMLVNLSGSPLTATRTSGLPPPASDPGYEPLRKQLLAGGAGYSSIMKVGDTALEVVGIPVMKAGLPVALLLGFADMKHGKLQAFVSQLAEPHGVTGTIDTTGTFAACSDSRRVGTRVDPAVIIALRKVTTPSLIRYRTDGVDMVTMIAPGIPGGWSYVRVETQNAYEGVVHTTNRTLSLTLFATLFVAVLSTLGLAYRGEMQRRRADERFRALVQHAPDMTALVDAQGRISYASPSAGSLLAVGAEPLAGRPLADAVHPDDRSVIQSVIDSVRQQRSGVKRVQCRVPDGDHAVRWLEFTASNQSGHSALGGVVINARDVTENRVLHEQLAHDAQHDTLTGLPNRRRMSTVMESLLRKEAVAVLFVDLDGFKPVNDVYGHAAGDELLRQVAYRVGRCIRGEDLLARVGGDEFVVLMPGVTRSDAEVAAARIQVAFDHPFQVMGAEVSVGASMGIHHATAASDPEQALREADKAMYKIKQARGAQRVRYAKDAS